MSLDCLLPVRGHAQFGRQVVYEGLGVPRVSLLVKHPNRPDVDGRAGSAVTIAEHLHVGSQRDGDELTGQKGTYSQCGAIFH